MRIIGLIFLLLLILSCGDTHEEGPSAIYYGEDICERCKMIISEKEFAAQYRLSDGKTVKFDDIGCMIHFMDEQKPEHLESVYVTDYDSGEWVNIENGYFVHTENVITPMGYGILSLSNELTAQDLAARENGEYLGKLSSATEFLLNNTNNKSEQGR